MRIKRSWLSAALGIVLAGLAPVQAQTSGWVNVRNINTSMDVQNATDGTLINATWKQAETVNWYHRATLGGQSFPLTSSNLLIKLEVFNTDKTILYLTETGSIYNAASGQMLFDLSPDDSNLIEGEYRGYMSLYQTNGASVVNMGVLAVARVTVEYSANSGNYTFIGNDIENVRSNAVYEIKLGSPVTTGGISRSQSSTGASYTIRFPAPNSIGTDLTARASIELLEPYTSRVVGVEAYTSRVVELEGYTSRVVGVEAYTSRVADIENTYSNNVRGGYFGSYTQDVVIGSGSVSNLGQISRKLTMQGVDEGAVTRESSIWYYPYGGIDYYWIDGAFGTPVLLLSNGVVQASRMTNQLDDVYQRIGVGASATNAVSSISVTGPVIGAVTLVGDGITQTDRVFNLNGYMTQSDAASTYLPLGGGELSGVVDMGDNAISNATSVGLKALQFDAISFLSISNNYASGSVVWLNSDDNNYPYYRKDLRSGYPFWGKWNLDTGSYALVSSLSAFTSTYWSTDSTTNYVPLDSFSTTLNENITTNIGGNVYFNNTATNLLAGLFVGTNILADNSGSFVHGYSDGTVEIGSSAYGTEVGGYIQGEAKIGQHSYGSKIYGYVTGTATMGFASAGSKISGYVNNGKVTVNAQGSSAEGYVEGISTIGSLAYGAKIIGYIESGASATNDGVGSVIFASASAGEHPRITDQGIGSVLIGAGIVSNARSLVVGNYRSHGNGSISAEGKIHAGVGFVGDMSGGTNFPSTLRTIAAEAAYNTNLFKVFWGAPTGVTQAVDSETRFTIRIPTNKPATNFYLGAANMGGTGTNWGRIPIIYTVP